ncbi:uncharacterized protein LOC121658530 isoform X1 [Corvus kubaryi]|uniref:uncharacterized protein LOC121658530 isoform X1 n=2 Tax=Corvus kubaryi TaxID=68294 RepID=UPI001C04309C|nr:uncharacterized protein LOC121658530 isoform X1 [Corvus kubaryi]
MEVWGGGKRGAARCLGLAGVSRDSHQGSGLWFGCRAVTPQIHAGTLAVVCRGPALWTPRYPGWDPHLCPVRPLLYLTPQTKLSPLPPARAGRAGRGWGGAAPGRAPDPFQSTGTAGRCETQKQRSCHWSCCPRSAAVSAKMSKKKPTPDEEPKKETISDEESGEETTPGDEPKDEAGPGKKRKVIGAAIGATAGAGKKRKVIGAAIGATVGAAVALVGIPVFIGALGFTGAGIAAGSIAAKMMSAAAIANGGGVAAGSTVAVLQSIGAAGFSIGAKIGLTSALGTVGGATGAWLSRWKKPPRGKPKKK